MLRTTPGARQVLVSYLQDLRTNPRPGPLRPRLEKAVSNMDTALERHLTNLSLSRIRSAN